MVALGFLAFLVIVAIFAPLLTPYDPNTSSLNDVLASPSWAHPLGADSSGRDVLSRMLYGARYSIGGALLASSLAVLLGMSAGLVAGYYRGWFESTTGWASNLVMTLPAFMVLLAARSVLGPSTWAPMVLLGIILAPAIYRVVLVSTRSTREELYVDAARVSGLSDARILSRHIVSAVRAPVIIMWALMAGVVIAVQAGLDFLGIDDPNSPTWGNILNDGFAHLQVDGTLLIWPSVAIALTSLSFVLVGNALRDELERGAPRRSRRRRAASVR